MISMSRVIKPVGIRIPVEIKDKLHQAAKENNRSVNAEVLARLQASLDYQEDSLLAAINRVSEQIGSIERELHAMNKKDRALNDLVKLFSNYLEKDA